MAEAVQSGCVMFDDDQRVRILHMGHRKNAEDIITTATEYRETLGEFENASSYVLEQLEGIAAEAEAKRKLALSMSMSIAAREIATAHVASTTLLKTSLKNAELEKARFETQSIASMQENFKQTRTAIIEVFGGQ